MSIYNIYMYVQNIQKVENVVHPFKRITIY